MKTEIQIKKLYERLSHRHYISRVWRDSMACFAIAMNNSVRDDDWQKREDRYLQIIKPYNKEELETMAEIFALLPDLYEASVKDWLGKLYMGIGGNKHLGQFFTPFHMSYLMAQITLGGAKDTIKEKGYITISDPAVGAGGMLVASIKTLQDQGISYQKEAVFHGCDLDETCVHMAYIQLTLLGCVGCIEHGDSLSQEITETWKTPFYKYLQKSKPYS